MLMSARPNFGYFVCAARGLRRPMREKETHGNSYQTRNSGLYWIFMRRAAQILCFLKQVAISRFPLSLFSLAFVQDARTRSTLIGNRSMILCHPIDARVASNTLLWAAKGKMLLKEEVFLRREISFVLVRPDRRLLQGYWSAAAAASFVCAPIFISIDADLKFVLKRTAKFLVLTLFLLNFALCWTNWKQRRYHRL